MAYTPNGHLLGKEMGSGITYKAGKWVSEVALPQVVNGSASDPAPTTLTPAQLTSRKVGALIHPGGKRLNFKAGKWIEEIYDGGWKNTIHTPPPTQPLVINSTVNKNMLIKDQAYAGLYVHPSSIASFCNSVGHGLYEFTLGGYNPWILLVSINKIGTCYYSYQYGSAVAGRYPWDLFDVSFMLGYWPADAYVSTADVYIEDIFTYISENKNESYSMAKLHEGKWIPNIAGVGHHNYTYSTRTVSIKRLR